MEQSTSGYLTGSDATPEADAAASPVARRSARADASAAQVRRIAAEATEFSILHRHGPWRDALRRRMLAGADVLGFVLATAVLLGAGGLGARGAAVTAGFIPAWILLAKLFGLYDRDHRKVRHLTADELPTILTWTITGSAALTIVMKIAGSGWTEPTALCYWAVATVAILISRAIARVSWRHLTPPERVAIVGSGPLARDARRKLEIFSDTHAKLVGTVSDGELAEFTRGHGLDDLLMRMRGEADMSRLIVASEAIDERMFDTLVRACRKLRVKLSFVPPARGMFGTAVQLDHVADLPLVAYNTWDVPRSTMLLKRIIDVTSAAGGLVVLLPLLVAIAAVVRLDSRGGSLFAQQRAGRFGRTFTMYKFRTMMVDAPERLDEVISLDQLPEPMFKLRDDPRITRVGRFLRRYSLDELPQLFNVLRGDMSIVGPRPEQVELVERYQDEHFFRLDVRPGLTGPMQVFGRGELTFDERLSVEREYVENISLRRDFTILLMTCAAVVKAIGAY